ncbi:MAG: hypothetical protein HY868_14205 [Chloroflexi bacterium]|nr:hypothetical protein [Chloroflexota bacterium]
MLDHKLYKRYLTEYLRDGIANSDGTNAGIIEWLMQQKEPGRFASHRNERIRALSDARAAFNEHRQWPTEIVLSFIGVKPDEVQSK